MKKPSLTLDTSCVISLLCLPEDSTPVDELESLEKIQQWGMESKIELFISEKSRTEALLNQDRARKIDPNNQARFKKWFQTLNILNNYSSVTGRWIRGVSRLGSDTVLGSVGEGEVYQEMAQLLFGSPPDKLKAGDLFDLAILFEHYTQGNELFVTRDKKNNILKQKSELERNWSVIVCGPVEAVTILKPLLEDG